jgi:5'-3' exonuclease
MELTLIPFVKSIVRVLARIQKEFGNDYGQMILCYDDKNYWRGQVFPYYKKNRKQERETSKYDWDMVFSVLNKIRDEIRRNLPYYVLQCKGAEADDVIASLSSSQQREDGRPYPLR